MSTHAIDHLRLGTLGAIALTLLATGVLLGRGDAGGDIALDVATEDTPARRSTARKPEPAGLQQAAEIAPSDAACGDGPTSLAPAVRGRVVDGDGEPVPGANVALYRDRHLGFGARLEADAVSHATADTRGDFVLEGLLGSEHYRIVGRYPGYVPVERRGLTRREPRTLAPTLVLVPGYGLVGVVVDGAGRGIAGAEVAVERARDGHRLDFVRTDQDGCFRATGLPVVTVHVVARADGFAAARAGNVLVGDRSHPVRLTVEPGRMIEGHVVDEATGRPLSGIVVRARLDGPSSTPAALDACGRAVPTDRVRRTTSSESFILSSTAERVGAVRDDLGAAARIDHEVLTDPDGAFRLTGLVDATYALMVSGPRAHADRAWRAATGERDVRLHAVTAPRLRVRLDDPTLGRAVVATTVHGDPTLVLPEHRRQVTLEGGLSPEIAVARGALYVHVYAEGFVPATVGPLALEGDAVAMVDVRLASGATVRGRIVARGDGSPVAGATVSLIDETADLITTLARREADILAGISSSTADDGTFVLPRLPEGRFRVIVRHPDLAEARTAPFHSPGAGELELGSIALAPGAVLAGEATDRGRDGRVVLASSTGVLRVVDAPGGRFRITGLPAGEYRLLVLDPETPDAAAVLAQWRTSRVVRLGEGEVRDALERHLGRAQSPGAKVHPRSKESKGHGS